MANDVSGALSAAAEHVCRCYPEEGCGVVYAEPDGSLSVHPMQNVYDRYHQKLPAQYPRTNRTAYLFDPKEQLHSLEQAHARGARLRCIFHSHADVGAYFSSEDKAMAAPDGLELHPGVLWLVLAVDRAQVTASKLFAFSGGDFVECPLETLVKTGA